MLIPSPNASLTPGSGIDVFPCLAYSKINFDLSTPITWAPARNHAAAIGEPTWPRPYNEILKSPERILPSKLNSNCEILSSNISLILSFSPSFLVVINF